MRYFAPCRRFAALFVCLLCLGACASRGWSEVLSLKLGIHMNCPYGLAG